VEETKRLKFVSSRNGLITLKSPTLRILLVDILHTLQLQEPLHMPTSLALLFATVFEAAFFPS